jgi:hypothetical protein
VFLRQEENSGRPAAADRSDRPPAWPGNPRRIPRRTAKTPMLRAEYHF